MTSTDVAVVALVGAGQLGSRHLQGLARSARAFDVVVVDPSPPALDLARRRYDEIVGAAARDIRYAATPAALPARVDLLIVATPASMRSQVVQEVVEAHRVRYAVLEKVLAQRPADLDRMADALARSGTAAWVNCPRRLNDFYRRARADLGGPGLAVTVAGGFWGLGCNGIHFIDLYAFLSGARVTAVETRGLDRRWYASKRAGFLEVAGTLVVHFEGGGRLVLRSDAESSAAVTITLQGPGGRATISEQAGRAEVALATGGGAPAATEFRLARQSELTHLVADRLLQDGDCALTTYAESAALHEPLLSALLAWSRETLGERLDAVRIT